MKQILITIAMGKRLIGKSMALHPEVKRVLEKGTLVIIAGTTNGYVAEEILCSLGQEEGFSRLGFRRGMVMAPGAQAPEYSFPGDVVIRDGRWEKGKSIFDVADDLMAGDVVLKGGNALDPYGQAAVHIGHPQGGTILAAMPAVVGHRVKLIVPIGLEKRIQEDVNTLAQRCNAPDARGPRLYPMIGETFTELDAIDRMTGAEATLIAAGGVYGAEGSIWLGISGTEEEIAAAEEFIRSVNQEPPCEV